MSGRTHTAKTEGRLSLNPLRHIDPIGAIFFIIFRFGWAKPVPVKTMYFKNPKRDMAITAIAGPISNILLAIAVIPFLAIAAAFNAPNFVIEFLQTLMYMNISFAIFNLIPIPPLDGSRLLTFFLPTNIYMKFLQYERYAFIVFILLMFTGVFSSFMGTATNFVANLLIVPTEALANFIFNLVH
ncbi:MAG: site-2 protease family protein [Clostridia bacterium]